LLSMDALTLGKNIPVLNFGRMVAERTGRRKATALTMGVWFAPTSQTRLD